MKLRLIRNPICDEIIEALAKEFAKAVKEPLVKEPLPCQCPEDERKPDLKLIKS